MTAIDAAGLQAASQARKGAYEMIRFISRDPKSSGALNGAEVYLEHCEDYLGHCLDNQNKGSQDELDSARIGPRPCE